MYGIQTNEADSDNIKMFENDVKMYGIQTHSTQKEQNYLFENDVKMYGIQTTPASSASFSGLRMM